MKKISMWFWGNVWKFIEIFGIQTKHSPYIFGKMVGASSWEKQDNSNRF